ncbi:hypothetical protein [Flavobacterium mekongense]|uniref:hypothetical protein n=1 Tax=Flavobacterium mekongense TaxID=3379707 RepID=UPI0039995B90
MRKNKFYRDFSETEIKAGFELMLKEMNGLDLNHPIRTLFLHAWEDFKAGKFTYDGPTFVRSRFKSIWELASFIHDWRNANGNVGSEIDNEFFSIMIALNYPIELFPKRYLLTRLTIFNVWRHRIKGSYNNIVHIKLYKL